MEKNVSNYTYFIDNNLTIFKSSNYTFLLNIINYHLTYLFTKPLNFRALYIFIHLFHFYECYLRLVNIKNGLLQIDY